MENIRVGIIGTGSIAARFARACAMVPGVCVSGISSRNKENGNRFAMENGIPRAYLGAEALVSSPDVDLVYVAVPHSAHFENCLLALQAGKSVLCEKPMSIKKEHAEILFAEAEKRGLFLMEGMWSRFLPTTLYAKKWIEEGRIGRVRFIDGIFSFAVDPDAPKPRLVRPELCGGATFDLNVYTVEMASYYAGANPVAWDGFATEYCPGTDASTVMILKYPNDILATLRTGITCEAPAMMTILGDQGRIEIPRFFAASEVRLYVNEKLVEVQKEDCELPKGFCYEIAAIRDYLRRGIRQSPVVSGSDTIATAEILENMMHRFFPERY